MNPSKTRSNRPPTCTYCGSHPALKTGACPTCQAQLELAFRSELDAKALARLRAALVRLGAAVGVAP